MYYTKCPDDDFYKVETCSIVKNTALSTVSTYLSTVIKYPQLVNIHGYQIPTVTNDSCCGLRGLWLSNNFLCWKNTKCAYKLWIAFGLDLYMFNPCVTSLQPSRIHQNGWVIIVCHWLYHEYCNELSVAHYNET
jgi:hypothetical protein